MAATVVVLLPQMYFLSLISIRKFAVCLIALYACLLFMPVSYVQANEVTIEIFETSKSSQKGSKRHLVEIRMPTSADFASAPGPKNINMPGVLSGLRGRYMPVGSTKQVEGRLHLVRLSFKRV